MTAVQLKIALDILKVYQVPSFQLEKRVRELLSKNNMKNFELIFWQASIIRIFLHLQAVTTAISYTYPQTIFGCISLSYPP